MTRNEVDARRRSAARFVVLITFITAVAVAALTGNGAGSASAQGINFTPRAFLSMIGNAGATATAPSATPTPTLTPTSSPTSGPTAEPGAYDQVHLAWKGPSSTTLTVVWRTADAATVSAVQYREAGFGAWKTATGSVRPSGTTGALHEVELTDLQPDTVYDYRVQADGRLWSTTFTARTAPAPGPATFDAVFFADTGLVGRADGLATGTQQAIDEMAKMKPLVLLGGGDYAYFDKDKRYGTLEATIDAWFNQVQPIASQAVLMPTYGNHEADPDLHEAYEPWAARFPTPDGLDNRRSYSFDVGDVHFISLFAPFDWFAVSDEQLAWLEADIVAAKDRGMRWIIPYFHVVMFGDGDVHDANAWLRETLAPLFERHGVQLVLYAHDQAYERSYPLADVTRTDYRVTSTSKTCYTAQEGVVYMKTSPAGKESNVSGSFSPFKTNPAPSWTAVRDNTMHHIARLRVSSDSIVVEAWGFKGDGSALRLQDSFKLTQGPCP